MCGIVGVLTNRPATPILMDALQRLEYRGYDSAGLAVMNGDRLDRCRAMGKLSSLDNVLDEHPLPGLIGIGHTRWATHGKPSEANAHPHLAGSVALVHNGIIENYQDLCDGLRKEGYNFESQTDSEVVAVLCDSMLRRGLSCEDAAAATIARLKGAYALCFLFEGQPDLLICARRGSPLAIGRGDGECFVASDAIALAAVSNRITYLEEGDWAVMTRNEFHIHDKSGVLVEREEHILTLDTILVDRGNYRHFMEKEIHEQTAVTARALGSWVSGDRQKVECAFETVDWANVPRLTLVACGTAYLACHVGKVWLEKIARIPVEIEIASEFRYREPPLPQGGVTLVVSQSGETADTLAAMRFAKARGQTTLALVNVATSSISREADIAMQIHAGPEIGVASTKAFTAQLICLAAMSVMIGRERGVIDGSEERSLVDLLFTVPSLLADTIALEPAFKSAAEQIATARNALFLGRGLMYPIALEGALKLKEITYIHAEGYAAGEIKHGPIALVDDTVPIIVLAPSGELFEKTASNLREVAARNGWVVAIGDKTSCKELSEHAGRTIALPATDPFLTPFSYTVAVQFLAYHAAVAKGTDVDQPRNLAKSVTVE